MSAAEGKAWAKQRHTHGALTSSSKGAGDYVRGPLERRILPLDDKHMAYTYIYRKQGSISARICVCGVCDWGTCLRTERTQYRTHQLWASTAHSAGQQPKESAMS